MATATVGEVRVPGLGTTRRKDAWWVAPLVQGLVFVAFSVYVTWAALQNANYWVPGTNYLSPFYAPELWGDSPHAWFGPKPDWLPYPSFLPFSPAVLILGGPLGFRMTCYYYRKFLYRSYLASPPSCAVGTLTGASYKGERKGLLLIMNLHRYFLYLALGFIVVLTWDAIRSFSFDGKFGIGVGSLVLTANSVLLACFTFGCNSLRHLVGGGTDCFSCAKGGNLKYAAWRGVSVFNRHHMLWAWVSMFAVAFADVYVRLVASGVWHDLRIV
jgi:hypothetical protein